MSDEPNKEADEGGTSGFTPPATQEDLNRIIAERVSRERSKYADYGDLKTKAAQFDEQAEAQKSELQRFTERAETAERELDAAKSETVRLNVIARYSIPAEYHEFIVGADEDELTAKAEKFKALVSDSAKHDPFPKADPSQGPKGKTGKQSTGQMFADALSDALK